MNVNKQNTINLIIGSGGALGAYAIGFIIGLKEKYPNINIRGASIGALIGSMYINNLIDDENTFRKIFYQFAGLPNQNNKLLDIDDLFNGKKITDTLIDNFDIDDKIETNPKTNSELTLDYTSLKIILTKSEPYYKWLDYFYLNKKTMEEITTSDIFEQKIAVLLSCRLIYPLNFEIDKLINKELTDNKQSNNPISIKPTSFINNWKSYYDGGFTEDLNKIAENETNLNPTIIIDLKKYSYFYIIIASNYNTDIKKLEFAKELYLAGKKDASIFIENNSITKCVYMRMLKYINKN
jgi:hypothetical protein